MLFTLEEVGVEVAMILATLAAIACFVTLLVYVVLERREVRREQARQAGAMTTVVQRTRSPRVAYGRVHTTSQAGSR
jgi:hypothetical protein